MIEIKGRNDGLVIRIVRDCDFDQMLKALASKVSSSFFRGASVTLDLGASVLTLEQINAIGTLLNEHGLTLVGIGHGQAPVKVQMPRNTVQPGALVVNRTLRSGTMIKHQGDVIVLGDVNPGAEIIATRNIVVMGALRGVARAGYGGNTEAFVTATKLRPTLLQIGDVLGRSPDEEGPEPEGHVPEVARIVDNVIAIDTPAHL